MPIMRNVKAGKCAMHVHPGSLDLPRRAAGAEEVATSTIALLKRLERSTHRVSLAFARCACTTTVASEAERRGGSTGATGLARYKAADEEGAHRGCAIRSRHRVPRSRRVGKRSASAGVSERSRRTTGAAGFARSKGPPAPSAHHAAYWIRSTCFAAV